MPKRSPNEAYCRMHIRNYFGLALGLATNFIGALARAEAANPDVEPY